MKKIGVFGCKTTTKFILDSLTDKFEISHLVTIDADLGSKNAVADYCDLQETARSHGVSLYYAKDYTLKSVDDIEYIRRMKMDLAFVIGWQRLIPEEILAHFSIGVFGMHGSSMDLPLGRGRSPMNWSILEDRKFFFTNLFRYDAGVDSGDILDTFLFSITPEDTAETMHFKNTLAMKYLIEKNIGKLVGGTFTLRKQKDASPTYYPKRSPTDSLIDWERDIFYIERHIRAVTKPFNGAYTFLEGRRVEIYRATIFETELVDFGYQDSPPGTVVEVFPNGKFLVRCFSGLLLVHEYVAMHAVTKHSRFTIGEEQVKYFQVNQYGNYDI